MKRKKLAALITAATIAVVPFTANGLSLISPFVVCAEDAGVLAELPDWVPSDYDSALAFRNTYGKTYIEDGLICIVFEQEKPYSIDSDMLRYQVKATEDVMDTLMHEVYSSDQSKGLLEVIVYAPIASGDFDVAIIDTWIKASSLELGYSHVSWYFTFTVSEDKGTITETDVFSWLPDCVTEYQAFTDMYGDVALIGNCVVFCLTYNTGTPYAWKRGASGDQCFAWAGVGDCSRIYDVPPEGGAINEVCAFQAVKDGYDKISYEFGPFYTTGEVEKTLTADCVVLDDAQTVLLANTARMTFQNYITGELLSFPNASEKIDIYPDIRYKTDDDDVNSIVDTLLQADKNPYIWNFSAFQDADIFEINLIENGLPEGYTLPEDYKEVKRYDNGAVDIVFKLQNEFELPAGATRVTLYDKDTGELISNEVLEHHKWMFGTDIRFKNPDMPGGWICTGPVCFVESNPCVYQNDFAKLYREADVFEFCCEDQPEVILYDNGAMDLVFRTKITVTGDINSDGTFSVADVVLLQKWLIAIPDVELYNWAEADYDLDNRLTAFDLGLMKRAMLERMYGYGSDGYDFEAQYIRTTLLTSAYPQAFPKTEIFSSRAALDTYITDHDELYRLSASYDHTDTSPSFVDAAAKYTAEWFDTHKLLVVVFEEGSGSISHEVSHLSEDAVRIKRFIPEVCTADIAIWHILVECDQDADISDDFDVIYSAVELQLDGQ